MAPGGLVILAAVAVLRLAGDTGLIPAMTTGYPYVIFAAAILLAWRFHRSRVVAAILAIGLVERALQIAGAAEVLPVHAAAAFLLPLVMAMLALARDRGVFTLRGLAHVGGVVLVAGATAYLLATREPLVTGLVRRVLLDVGFLGAAGVPQPVVIATLVGLAGCVVAGIRRAKVVERSFGWATLATFLAFRAQPGSAESSLFFMAAGLILVLSVVESSYSMAYYDDLTALPARRAMRDALGALRESYAIAMVDIDHFKRFNDRHGHDVGDQVLRMVASRLKAISGGGRAFRYGGEEFAVLFPGKNRDEAEPHLEQLREAIEKHAFTLRRGGRRKSKPEGKNKRRSRGGGKRLAVTVSIGVAERSGRFPTVEKVLEAADRALYRAKRTGRNRVSR